MQPRTLAALAVAAGLTLGTGVLAIGATLMPSGASPRPYAPVAADVASDPGTTIVTDVRTVYDDPPSTAQPGAEVPTGTDDQPESVESTTTPAPAPRRHRDTGGALGLVGVVIERRSRVRRRARARLVVEQRVCR